jgi:hypothetical protein
LRPRSLSERLVCEWIASQERIAIAAIESQERLELQLPVSSLFKGNIWETGIPW